MICPVLHVHQMEVPRIRGGPQHPQWGCKSTEWRGIETSELLADDTALTTPEPRIGTGALQTEWQITSDVLQV